MRSEKENENVEIPDLEKQQSDSGAEPSSLSKSAVGDTVPPLLNVVVLDEVSRRFMCKPPPICQGRVCQQEKDEVLIDLGCQCRGGLAKSHRSCIDTWFRTRGSNKCEICQGVAANVPPPQSQPTGSYWVWRVDSTYRSQNRDRGCVSPLYVAFSILIGGLLLDVLISVTLGIIVVLGLGTALRLILEFFHQWSLRRVVQRVDTNVPLGYHPAL
ncbi:uncharacterized protein Pyn_15797 [Prunus yedoensis var. nudiflora]|uniref:RING-CH-type domain-containing protein n=1 Tax=Prunus yedoensis var. nudiflora TaxID=2094558 RepID=A0A314XL42_PRUYE|nr:uncharacterized protein Pyn_15797 [Prunus yedoensis var. nudiflora]